MCHILTPYGYKPYQANAGLRQGKDQSTNGLHKSRDSTQDAPNMQILSSIIIGHIMNNHGFFATLEE